MPETQLRSTGYSGYEPFGAGVLRPPQQPRPALLGSNIDSNIELLQEWLLGCTGHHEKCQSGKFYPRRLLHVGAAVADPANEPIRLVEMPPRPLRQEPFIALSHCWGQTQHALTTKDNYEDRQAGIAMSQLSKTFQDAVWLTRRLGIKYIWIDSLCIVQDDMDDWEREAATMPRLYAAAYLTIAAAHGADGSAGVLYDDESARARLLQVDLQVRGDQTTPATVVLTPRVLPRESSDVHKFYGSEDEIMNPSLAERGLLRRAWAFQERALSTRIVHFTHEELVWECSEGRTCECGTIRGSSFLTSLVGSIRHTNGQPDSDESDEGSVSSSRAGSEASWNSWSATSDSFFREQLQLGKGIESLEEASSSTLWWTFVQYYTTRQLTRPEDRGPAFRGIAEIFSAMVLRGSKWEEELGEYCAGIWAEHLPQALLWATEPQSSRRISRDAPAAPLNGPGGMATPSWSWYSVTGPCRLLTFPEHLGYGSSGYRRRPRHGSRALFPFEFVDTFMESGDEPGTKYDRQTGALTLHFGRVAAATRTSASDAFALRAKSPGRQQISTPHQINLVADDPDDQNFVGELVCLELGSGSHEVWIHNASLKLRVPAADGTTWARHEGVLSREDYSRYLLDDEDFNVRGCNEHRVGLALVAVDGDQETYRRLGVFHASGPNCVGFSYTEGSSMTLEADLVPKPSDSFVEWAQNAEWKDNIRLV